jgi:ferredoxin
LLVKNGASREVADVPVQSTRRRLSAWNGSYPMAFVVTENCYGCKYTDCVVVCPSDSFREGDQMLYINPETCIDCWACLPECPVEAIFYEEDVPEKWREYVALNAEMAQVSPPIVERKEPLAS